MFPPLPNTFTSILKAGIFLKPWEAAFVAIFIICGLCLLWLVIANDKEKKQSRLQEINFAKLELLSRIDHDLKAPLMMITSSIERLKQDDKGCRASAEFEDLEHGAQLLQDGIDQLLEMKSADLGGTVYHPSYGDLSRFVEEVSALYSAVNPSVGAGLTANIVTSPLMTEFDARKMRRIIYNLLNEVYSRCGKDAKVTLTVAKTDGNAQIAISADNKFHKGAWKGIFNARRTLNDSRGILGIGMKIAEDYVHLHGGSLHISEDARKGNVSVMIPVRTPQWEGLAGVLGQHSSVMGSIPHILYVEDNPDFRTFITGRLSDRFNVTEAGNGKEAMDLITEGSFDLVLSDVRMPEMDGRELCRTIRADIRYAHIPVMLLTDVPGKESELENLLAGADDSIEKPFDVETLIVRIERILKRAGNTEDYPGGRRISRMDSELLSRIDAEIEKNMQDSEYTIETLCSSLSISRSGLYKKLMQLTGRSPLEYIRIKRLQVGRKMLESGENSVSQIAWSVGFSPKQFSKYFRDIYGCLPSEYIHHLSE